MKKYKTMQICKKILNLQNFKNVIKIIKELLAVSGFMLTASLSTIGVGLFKLSLVST